jgi:hypothetical protein
MGRIENAEMAEMAESGGKWLQSIIFHSRLIVGIGTATDGRTQSPIIKSSCRWPGEKWLRSPEMPKGA